MQSKPAHLNIRFKGERLRDKDGKEGVVWTQYNLTRELALKRIMELLQWPVAYPHNSVEGPSESKTYGRNLEVGI